VKYIINMNIMTAMVMGNYNRMNGDKIKNGGIGTGLAGESS